MIDDLFIGNKIKKYNSPVQIFPENIFLLRKNMFICRIIY